MKTMELRRHARRDRTADQLSPAGRSQAEDAGRTCVRAFDLVFVSPAQRAAETAAWFLRGAGSQLPDHEVIPGLAGHDASGGSPDGMAAGIRALLDRAPSDGCVLAVSHSPFVERAAQGLTGRETEPMAELEGLLITQSDDGAIAVEEIRLA